MTAALSVMRLGPVAAEILAHDGDAEVAAVHERSVTVMTRHGFVTLGGEGLGDGPLNILLSRSLGPVDWLRFHITREAKGSVSRQRLLLGDTFALDTHAAAIWEPPPWPTPSRTGIVATLAHLRSVAPLSWPAEGLSRLVIAGALDRSDRSARAAAPTIREIRRLLPTALRAGRPDGDLTRAATLLIGLGPGLTPSGDDMLGGLFLALSALGRTELRDALWDALAPELDLLTTGFSGAHLAAAADGLAAALLHAALAAMLSGTLVALPGHLDALRSLGHSSGADALAGLVLALEAVVSADVL
jgi:hypothetical protein